MSEYFTCGARLVFDGNQHSEAAHSVTCEPSNVSLLILHLWWKTHLDFPHPPVQCQSSTFFCITFVEIMYFMFSFWTFLLRWYFNTLTGSITVFWHEGKFWNPTVKKADFAQGPHNGHPLLHVSTGGASVRSSSRKALAV